MLSRWRSQLVARRARKQYRQRHVIDAAKDVLNFSTNDYLGLASDARIRTAAQTAVDAFGVGARASQMISGYSCAQRDFENAIADFLGFEAAMVFSSGYLANIGVLTALATRQTTIVADRLNHASLIDGAQYSAATVLRYRHNDIEHCRDRLNQSHAEHTLIVSDGVFSMEGDLAKLPELAALGAEHSAMLMIDDAHGIGVLGDNGRGTLEQLDVGSSSLSVLVGTLGKSFGGFGAFVCASKEIIDYLAQFARTAIYTTALPPLLMACASASLAIIQTEPWRREKLQDLIHYYRNECRRFDLEITESMTPIQLFIVGSDEHVMAMQAYLLQQGILVGAIRPPTVPQGQARLRISFNAHHEKTDIDRLLAALRSFIHGQHYALVS